jgi:hypothetical protein
MKGLEKSWSSSENFVILNLGTVVTGADGFGANPFSGARLHKRASRTTDTLNTPASHVVSLENHLF